MKKLINLKNFCLGTHILITLAICYSILVATGMMLFKVFKIIGWKPFAYFLGTITVLYMMVVFICMLGFLFNRYYSNKKKTKK